MSRLFAIWWAVPVKDDQGQPSGALLPWDLVNLTPTPSQQMPAEAWQAWAHRCARIDRAGAQACCPGLLVAVRSLDAGPPVYPVNMLDHYDLPPYV